MLRMEKWIRSLKPKLHALNVKQDPVTIVIGNEACDLDSGVCALVLAYHRHILAPHTNIFPLLNIPAKDFVLKTELVHCLEKYNIRENDVLFKDTLDLHSIGNVSLILVDHNVLTPELKELEGFVTEVYDHHALERKEDSNTKILVETVGSCSSLVTQTIRSENESFSEKEPLELLLATILLDTVALQPGAKKVTAKDVEMVEWIESRIGSVDRSELFKEVSSAKTRFQHLSPHQLLRRDLKCIVTDKTKVGLSSVPMLAKNYLEMEGAEEALEAFSGEENLNLVMVLGICFQNEGVSRDLFLYEVGSSALGDTVATALQAVELGLELKKEEAGLGMLFSQGNVAGSRKQILPAVKKLVSAM